MLAGICSLFLTCATQVARLGGKWLHQLSHLAGPCSGLEAGALFSWVFQGKITICLALSGASAENLLYLVSPEQAGVGESWNQQPDSALRDWTKAASVGAAAALGIQVRGHLVRNQSSKACWECLF